MVEEMLATCHFLLLRGIEGSAGRYQSAFESARLRVRSADLISFPLNSAPDGAK